VFGDSLEDLVNVFSASPNSICLCLIYLSFRRFYFIILHHGGIMYAHKSYRPTWIEIDMDAIRSNYRFIQSVIPDAVAIMGVVKADAYGHGAIPVSQELLKIGADYLAVSNVDEAIELREAGISSPMLILGPVEKSEFGKLIQFNLFPTVTSLAYARELVQAYRYRGVFPKIHIKVDTGMGRLGLFLDNALMDIEQIAQLDGVIIDGIFSHFPSADVDLEYSIEQLNRFKSLINKLQEFKIKIKHFHIANSAAILKINGSVQLPFDMVRPGLALYGYSTQKNKVLKNSMSLKTRIMDIRKMKKGDTVSYLRQYTIREDGEHIAVLPVGYADGIPTLYSNKGRVLIGGEKYPQVGRICMDYIMVSLGKNPENVVIGDVATIFGNQSVSIEDLARLWHKTPYEVTCGMTKRVPRIYTRKNK